MSSASLHDIFDIFIQHRDVHRFALQALYRVCPQHPDLVAQLLKECDTPIVNEPDNAATGVDARALAGLLEHDIGFASRAGAQKAPDGGVLQFGAIANRSIALKGAQAVADGRPQLLLDDHGLLPLGPLQDLRHSWHP